MLLQQSEKTLGINIYKIPDFHGSKKYLSRNVRRKKGKQVILVKINK